MRYWLLLPLLVFNLSLLAKTKPFHISREDGSFIQGYLTKPDHQQDFPIVIFIDGSAKASVFENHKKLASLFDPHKIGFVSIEKRGISPKKINRKEFLQHDCFEERLQDHVTLLKRLKEKGLYGSNHPYIILGASEGGKIAPSLSLLFPENIQGIALIGAGGGLSFGTELQEQKAALISQLNPFKKLAYKLYSFINEQDYPTLYPKMLASPESLKTCNTKTWKWFASYLKHEPLPDLLKIEAPIYMIHGEQDLRIPIKSADLVKDAFDKAKKTNLTYARYKDLGHSLAGREDVYTSLIEWIKNIDRLATSSEKI